MCYAVSRIGGQAPDVWVCILVELQSSGIDITRQRINPNSKCFIRLVGFRYWLIRVAGHWPMKVGKSFQGLKVRKQHLFIAHLV